MKENITNNKGQLLGSVITESNGNLRAYSANGRYLGEYNSRDNRTFDSNGRLVGSGVGSLYGLIRD